MLSTGGQDGSPPETRKSDSTEPPKSKTSERDIDESVIPNYLDLASFSPGSTPQILDSNFSNLQFADLLDVDELADIMSTWAIASNMANIICSADTGENITQLTGFTEYCHLVRETQRGLADCFRFDERIGAAALKEGRPVVRSCPSGLIHGSAVIKLPSGDPLGYILIGQVCDQVSDILPQMRAYGGGVLGLDIEDIDSTIDSLYELPTDQFQHHCDFIWKFTSKISDLSYFSLLQKANIKQLAAQEYHLKLQEAELSSCFASIDNAILLFDIHGYVVRLNRAAQRILHICETDGDLIRGRRSSELFSFVDFITNETLPNPVELVYETGKKYVSAHDCLFIRTASDASERHPIVTYSATPMVGHELGGCVLVITDVSEERQASARVAESSKFQLLGRFTSFTVHNMNQLLQSIMGCAEALRLDEMWNKQQRDKLNIIINAACQCSDLIKQLLTFTANPGTSVLLPVEITSLVTSIFKIVSMYDPTIDVRLNLNSLDRTYIEADRSQLQAAIMNCAVNAMEALTPYSEGKVLELSCSTIIVDEPDFQGYGVIPGKLAVISIIDNGIGIPQDHFDKIFEPFFTTKTTSATMSGTGIGLSSVRGTVIAHHGAIWLESTVGNGEQHGRTAFHLAFPVHVSEDISILDSITLTEDFDSLMEEIRTGNLSTNKEIVFVDDNRRVQTAILSMLERFHYSNIKQFLDPREALEYLHNCHEQVGLVILDQLMPYGYTGEKCLDEIRIFAKDLPIAFASGYKTDETNMTELSRRGVIGFLKKPFGAIALWNVLKHARK